MTQPDRPPVSGEPSRVSNQCPMCGGPATMIRNDDDVWEYVAIEAEARATPPSLDADTLAEAIVATINAMVDGTNGLLDHSPREVAARILSRLTSKEER